MRHRRKGRVLGRSPSHRKALLSNLARCLILTELDEEYYEATAANPPAHKGRIVTTLHKAKEVRPLVEKCITIARKALPHEEKAAEFAVDADRNTEEWRQWRKSDDWQKWSEAMAPAVNARRRVFQILRDKKAVKILFEDIAPRFLDRPGGYTRIMRLAKPRLGDAGTRAILEFVGTNDRVRKQDAEKPAFADDDAESNDVENEDVIDEVPNDEPVADEDAVAESSEEGSDEDSKENSE